MKACSRCKIVKEDSEFGADTRATTGLRSPCRQCESQASLAYMRNHRESFNAYRKTYHRANRGYVLVSTAKKRSLKRGHAFDLDQYKKEIQERIDAGFCELSGIPFDLLGGRTFASPSIDRIEPSKGYVYSNIRIVCNLMNMALGDWGEETLDAVITSWLRKRSGKGITESDGGGVKEEAGSDIIDAV